MEKMAAITSSHNKELSHSEAIFFLKHTLKIEFVEQKIKYGSKLALMQEITRKFQEHIPFQNLSLLAGPGSTHDHFPTMEEIKEDYFAARGGMSYTTTIFAQQVLNVLGYDTFLVSITVPFTEKIFTHVAFVVTDVTSPGQRFLIDLGVGYPTFEPVPLHLLPLYYNQAFLEYKLIQQDDGLIIRYHKIGNHFLGKIVAPVSIDGWQKFYEFEITKRNESFIKQYQAPVYLVSGYGTNWDSEGLKMAIYPSNHESYAISDFELKKWKKGKGTQIEPLRNVNDLEIAIKMYFPSLTEINVQQTGVAGLWKERKCHKSKTTSCKHKK